MPTIEEKLYGWILSWLQTHRYSAACDEAIARKLAQRVTSRLERHSLLKEQNEKGPSAFTTDGAPLGG